MLRNSIYLTLAFGALAGAMMSGPVAAQQGQTPPAQAFTGLSLFASYCTICHGDTGKGDGRFAATLRSKPTDLTAIAKNNGGVFSRENLARIVDGREPIRGHGSSDMPVWGDAFAHSLDGSNSVNEKIQSLVGYVESIQQNP